MSVQLTIDKEFEELIQPLADQELALLTEQILRDGCHEPLSVWKTEDDQRILLDGHNRYKICTENNQAFQTINLKLDSREQAKLWILEHQVGRRNLTDDQRACIWVEIIEQRVVVSRAKQLEAARATKAGIPVEVKITPTEQEPKPRVREAAAAESGISESKLRSVQKLKNTSPEHYSDVGAGRRSLREVRQTLRKPKASETDFREKDFYARVARGLDSAFSQVDDRLKKLARLTHKTWTPEAADGIHQIILRLTDVADRADAYRLSLERVEKKINKRVA